MYQKIPHYKLPYKHIIKSAFTLIKIIYQAISHTVFKVYVKNIKSIIFYCTLFNDWNILGGLSYVNMP